MLSHNYPPSQNTNRISTASGGLRIWLPVEDPTFLAGAVDLTDTTRPERGIEILSGNPESNPERFLQITLLSRSVLSKACKEHVPARKIPIADIISAVYTDIPGATTSFDIRFTGLLGPKGTPPARNDKNRTAYFLLQPSIEDGRILSKLQTVTRSLIQKTIGTTLPKPQHKPDLLVALAHPQASDDAINELTMYYSAITQNPLTIHLGPMAFYPNPNKASAHTS